MSGKQKVLEALRSAPGGIVGHAGVAAAAGISKGNAAVCLHRLGDRVTYVDVPGKPGLRRFMLADDPLLRRGQEAVAAIGGRVVSDAYGYVIRVDSQGMSQLLSSLETCQKVIEAYALVQEALEACRPHVPTSAKEGG